MEAGDESATGSVNPFNGSRRYTRIRADVAQLVEHFTRNEGVRGSNPRVGSHVCKESWLM